MPYKFQIDKIKLPEGTDRRIKLTPQQKKYIHTLHHEQGYSIRGLTRMYNVSRRTIQFTCYPERLEHNKILRAKRGGWQQYYNKDDHAKSTREHRRYKHLVLQNLIK